MNGRIAILKRNGAGIQIKKRGLQKIKPLSRLLCTEPGNEYEDKST